MSALYSYNDWRDYALVHERKSQWTDENGRNTPAYNHKYYEEHREEIIKRVTENRRNSRTSNRTDYEKNGYDWKNKNARGKAYANDDERRKTYLDLANDNAFSDNEDEDSLWKDADDSLKGNKEYSEDVLENIRKNNENARNNIRKLQETVQNYVKANSEKLTTDQIAKLYQDLEQQTALERKRVIDISSKEGKSYVDGLLKGDGNSSSRSSKSSDSTKKNSSKSSSRSSSQSSSNSSNSGSTSSKDIDKKSKKKTAIDELVDKYGDLTPEERRKMKHSEEYTYNDWRYYLQHKAEKGKSKYDWSTGTNPPDYNHDYWEKNKEEILAQRAKKAGKSTQDVEKENVRNFGGKGVGNKARSEDGKSYENSDDWSKDLTDDEKKNIDAHNKKVDENIANLTKTVEDYIAANKDKLGEEDIKKLRDNLQTQIDIANEQRISTKNSDDRDYIMSLRKQSGESSKGVSSNQPKQSSLNSSSKSATKSTSSSTKSAKSVEYNEKKNDSTDARQQRNEQLEEKRSSREVDNFNYDNEEARRRKEEQELIRYAGRMTN